MNAAACAVLALAVFVMPQPAAMSRWVAMWPSRTGRRTWHPWTVTPMLAAGGLGLLLAGPAGAVAGALVAHTMRGRRRGQRQEASAAATAAELADAVRRMTDELRTGSHPATALDGVAADGQLAREVLARAAVAARLGDGVAAALRRDAARRPEVAQDVERIATAWSLAERHGIPLADLLDRAHADIRWRARFGATVRAQLAGPRATATVLTVLPLLGLGLGQLIGADPLGVLRSGLLGQALLVVGVGLATAGMAWSDHILRAAVPR